MPTAATDGIATYYEVYGSGPALLMMGSGSFDSTVERFATNEWKGIRPFETFARNYTASLTIDAKRAGQVVAWSGSRIAATPIRPRDSWTI